MPTVHVGPIQIDTPTFLAPMAAVTDLPFRTVCEEHGAGFTITEFLSAHALSQGAKKAVEKLAPSLGGRKFGVQIFGREIGVMARAAEMAVSAGASLVDINMGCPAKRVVAGECGSALMKEPQLAQEIVRAVRHAVPRDVPVTVKHRAGWDERHLNAPEFAQALVEAGASLITVHGRTRTQGFSGTCDLGILRRVRDAVPRHVPVVGNGDVVSMEGYLRMREVTGCDAVMIGRGAMGNPFLFRSIRAVEQGERDPGPPTLRERVGAFERHVELILSHGPSSRHHVELRKACAWYSRGLHGGSALRQKVFSLCDPAAIVEEARSFFAEQAKRGQGQDARAPLSEAA
ncbi:MAG: tRNA dihydrouridine synthase DusB [Deltaproteobacteria bacterium]|nr:tRNA dihydrouridine synthase DusB [Deltaproteobacteria bacterium]